MRGVVPGVSLEQVERARDTLRLLLRKVDEGDLEATPQERGALVGAVAALEGVGPVDVRQ